MKVLAIHLYFALALASAPICASAGEVATVPADFSIRLTRGACEGPCPVYSVSVDSQGRVQWQGKQFVRRKGKSTKTIAAASLQSIVRRIGELHVLAVQPGTHISHLDASLVTVELTLNSRSIQVAYSQSDTGPDASRVVELAKYLDRELVTDTWIGGNEYRRMND